MKLLSKFGLILCLLVPSVAYGALTQVQDTLFRADGTFCSGQMAVSWQTFTATDGHLIVAGSTQVRVVAGLLSIALEPGQYVARYQLVPSGCSPNQENWLVPASATPVPLSTVRSLNPPTPPVLLGLAFLGQGGATVGQCLVWGGSAWTPSSGCGGGGGGSPGGLNTQVQFNNLGAFGADSNFNWNNTTKTLGLGAAASSTYRLFASGADIAVNNNSTSAGYYILQSSLVRAGLFSNAAGTLFEMGRYDNSGNYLDDYFNGTRASGLLTIPHGLTVVGALTTNIASGTQCVHANSSGVLSGTGMDCGSGGSSNPVTLTTVSFSATPTFSRSTQIQEWQLTLTGNVTGSSLSGQVAADIFIFNICQNSGGGHTFVPPTGFAQMATISVTANACTKQTFYWDGTNAIAVTPGVTTDSLVKIPLSIFSLIPACGSITEGALQPITDSTTNTWGGVIGGGGIFHVMGFCDGVNWSVMGK